MSCQKLTIEHVANQSGVDEVNDDAEDDADNEPVAEAAQYTGKGKGKADEADS